MLQKLKGLKKRIKYCNTIYPSEDIACDNDKISRRITKADEKIRDVYYTATTLEAIIFEEKHAFISSLINAYIFLPVNNCIKLNQNTGVSVS